MIFITGGFYQGKLKYAKERFGLKDKDIFVCSGRVENVDFSKRCIVNIEELSLALAMQELEPAVYFAANKPLWEGDKILICTDVSCGIVPEREYERAWREKNSRLANYLARSSEETVRMFLGLPQVLKP